MDLEQAKTQLSQAQALVVDLEGKVAADSDNEGLKAQLAAAKDKATTAQTLVDAISSAMQAKNEVDILKSTNEEQVRTIERLSTTSATVMKRTQALENKQSFTKELEEIKELSVSDPGAAAQKLAGILPEIQKATNKEAVDRSLTATQIYIDNRQAIDRVRSDPKYAHLLPYEDSIRGQVVYLTQYQGKPILEAVDIALKQAQALYDSGKKAGEPANPPKPAPGAQGAQGGGSPPAPKSEPIMPTPSAELASTGALRRDKARGVKSG